MIDRMLGSNSARSTPRRLKAAVRASRICFSLLPNLKVASIHPARAFRPVVPYFVDLSCHTQSSGRAHLNRAAAAYFAGEHGLACGSPADWFLSEATAPV